MKTFFNKKFFIQSFAIIGLSLVFFTLVAQAAYTVEIGLPGMAADKTFSDPGAYVRILFIFGLSLAGFLAVGAIAWGGIQWMTASSVGSKQKAKDWIIGALSGIVLLLCSYLILATIDPTLTNLTPTIIPIDNVAAPPPGSAATRDCNPSCTTGFFCRASDFTCQKIPAGTASQFSECLDKNTCTEAKCAPSGRGKCTVVASVPLVWNPNTCNCVKP